MDSKELIARRAALELHDGDVVNLGIGLPTKIADYLPADVHITLQAEHGALGTGPAPEAGQEDPDIVNAGGQYITVKPGAMFFDSATSFGMIRGGHVDATILGTLEVDEKGNLSNWIIPGKMVPGMGGAMDLVVGAKKVIITMLHTQKGKPKILRNCTLPYTALGVVDMIITEMGVMEITPEGIKLIEINPDYTVAQVQEATEAELIIAPDIKALKIDEDGKSTEVPVCLK